MHRMRVGVDVFEAGAIRREADVAIRRVPSNRPTELVDNGRR